MNRQGGLIRPAFTCLAFLGAIALAASAADKGPIVEWSATDTQGAAIKVPAVERSTVVVFALPQQAQSRQVLEQLAAAVKDRKDVQVVVVVSGKEAQARARQLVDETKIAWPIVLDLDYSVSGRMNVHAWPTTIVVAVDGRTVAHIAGPSKSYVKDMDSYLAAAAGKLDAAGLEQKLHAHDTVVDSPAQMAQRHLLVAQRLLEKGMAREARSELERAMALAPGDGRIGVTAAEALLALGEPQTAMTLLERTDTRDVPAARVRMLRGRALVGLGRFEEARGVLVEAVRLNPNPSTGYYELGLVYQHLGQWKEAAEAFRRAYETTGDGRKVAEPTVVPATQPAK